MSRDVLLGEAMIQNFLFSAGAVVVLLGGLIFVHELGHFLVAKALGVKVLRFSIGFGPRLLGFTAGETEYRIAALPLGGYVKMAGEDPTQDIPPEDVGRTFLEQPPWRRLCIAVAGPAMNLAFPVLLYFAIALSQRGALVPGAAVGTVAPGTPAAVAGLQGGDRIRAVRVPGHDPLPVRYFDDLRKVIAPHPGEPLEFTVERGGQTRTVTIIPAPEEESNQVEKRVRGVIGVISSWPTALAAPARGVPSPLQPLDLVVKVDGREVHHAGDLTAALASAACRPVALEVRRAAGARREPVTLAAVPTCTPDGAPAVQLADPMVAAYVAAVDPGSPAERAGLSRGDRLTSVAGKPVRSVRDLEALSSEFVPGQPLALALDDGRALTLTPGAEPYRDEDTHETRQLPVLGFRTDDRSGIDLSALAVERLPFEQSVSGAFKLAAGEVGELIRMTVVGLGKIATGSISFRQVGGPIRLFSIAAEAAEAGLSRFLLTMGLVSINLGLMNLLPIPVLDGGHILTAVIEGVTRRRLSLRVREVTNWVGLALILALMVFVMGNDIIWKWG